MAPRVVYGNSFSENGWPMVDQDSCQWVTVPGTDVSLQIQMGQPLILLRAFAADFNAYVEPLRDADSACWTATNSVATSNHLSGTALDLNWNSHPFQILNAGFTSAQINTVRDLLDFYEDTIWWGNDWDSPKDAMHFQVGYNTYQNAHTQDVINRKIRADGYSTFRRGGTSAPPVTSKQDRYALAIIEEGRRRGITARGIQIALATALVESNLKMYANASVPESLKLPYDAIGSDHDSVGLFQQRCPMWGPADILMDPAKSAGLFYDRLVRSDYNNPTNSPGWYAQNVQRSAFPGRYDERFADAVALYNRLATTPDPATDPILELLMSDLSVESLSIYATPGEPLIPIVRMIQSIDAADHRELVESAARLGDRDSLDRIARTAAGKGKFKDPATINHAKAVLADIEASNPNILKDYLAAKGA